MNAARTVRKRLADAFPTRPTFLRQLAMSHHSVCSIFFALGRFEESEAALKEALAIQTRLAGEFPLQPDLREELATSHNSLGELHRARGRFKEGERAYRDAIAIYKRLADEFPTRSAFGRYLALGTLNLGLLLKAEGRSQDAEKTFNEALGIRKKLAKDFPKQPELNNEAAVAFIELIGLCNERRDFVAAKVHLEKAGPWSDCLTTDPKNSEFRATYREALSVGASTLAGLLEQAKAMNSARRIRDLRWEPSVDAYVAAAALARCIPLVAENQKLDGDHRKAAMQFYGDEAVRILREAVAKGFQDVEKVGKETALNPLREREDFKTLVGELEEKNRKSKAK